MSWRSAKQSMTTSSTMEAEYVACYEATRHAVWFQNFICDSVVVDSIERHIMMYFDTTKVASFSNNLKGIPGVRYINVKYFVIKKKVKWGFITIVHNPTYSMVVDPLTKALPVGIFEENVSRRGFLSN